MVFRFVDRCLSALAKANALDFEVAVALRRSQHRNTSIHSLIAMIATPKTASSTRSRSTHSDLDSLSWTPTQKHILERLDRDERFNEERRAHRVARQEWTADGRLRKHTGPVHRAITPGLGRIDTAPTPVTKLADLSLKTTLTPMPPAVKTSTSTTLGTFPEAWPSAGAELNVRRKLFATPSKPSNDESRAHLHKPLTKRLNPLMPLKCL